MTQVILNNIIADQKRGLFNFRVFAQSLHKYKIEAVAMRFHGVAVRCTEPLFMSEHKLEKELKEQKELKVSYDLKMLIQELHLEGLAVYFIDYSDQRFKNRY